ncbi:MAG TPA: GWxTD domain-containing protein [Nitrospira sp.]|nr:GWxTD domain-containing protein [Nitrospira sp.]
MKYFGAFFAFLFGSVLLLGQSAPQAHLSPEYKKWVTDDVRWIITTQERQDFIRLTSNQDRDRFIAAFWERRNPNPHSTVNAFKEEHYRRLAFANQHFAAGKAGFKTDRGRIYVVYGPPDSIVARPATSVSAPIEVWSYHHMKGGGDEVHLKFVDECYCGDYDLETTLPNNLWDNTKTQAQ